MTNVSAFIIDMDGVLWHGSQAMPGLVAFFDCLREKKLPFVLATNNASLTQQQYIDKLAKMGVTVQPEEILTSSMATATYLAEHQAADKRRAFVIGEAGLREPLEAVGFTLTDLYDVKAKEGMLGADVVVTGLDRKLTWDKLATATLLLQEGAEFYATNSDTSLPTELGDVMGNGGTIAALTAVTGQAPMSIGKPQPILYQQALSVLGVTADETVAIGDRLNTDILGAVNAGMRSIFVLSGISDLDELKQVDYEPTWILDDITEITAVFRKTFN